MFYLEAWSKKAINEASKIMDVNTVTSSESSNFNNVPNEESLEML